MCVSLPGRVVSLRDGLAEVERNGGRMWCNALLQPDLRPGDWVLTHGGLALEVIDEAEAAAIVAALGGERTTT